MGGRPPHQRSVLVKEPWKQESLAWVGAMVFRQENEGHQESEAVVISCVREIKGSTEQFDLVFRGVPHSQEFQRIAFGRARGFDRGSVLDELPELVCDLPGCQPGRPNTCHDRCGGSAPHS